MHTSTAADDTEPRSVPKTFSALAKHLLPKGSPDDVAHRTARALFAHAAAVHPHDERRMLTRATTMLHAFKDARALIEQLARLNPSRRTESPSLVDPAPRPLLDAIVDAMYRLEPPASRGDAGEVDVRDVVQAVAHLFRNAGATTNLHGGHLRPGAAPALTILETASDLVPLGKDRALRIIAEAHNYAGVLAHGRNDTWLATDGEREGAAAVMMTAPAARLADTALGAADAGRIHAPCDLYPRPQLLAMGVGR